MKIRKINAMRGPNYWSIDRHKLIVIVLELQEMEDVLSSKIPEFEKRLKTMMPGLNEYFSGLSGDFPDLVQEGVHMDKIIEHIGLEIQTLAGMDVSFGRTQSYGEKGVRQVIFEYLEEEVGIYAAKAAVRICESLISGEKYDLKPDIQEMREIREEVRLGPSTASIIEEAVSRGIPW